MNRETLADRVKEIQTAVDKSAADHQQYLANHHTLLGMLREAQYRLDEHDKSQANVEVVGELVLDDVAVA